MSIQAELKFLKTHGELTADRVIIYARNEKTELHRCFLWDDTEAAHRYRLQQANAILRIHVTIREVPQRNVNVSVQIEPGAKPRIITTPDVVAHDPFEEPTRIWKQDGFLCFETVNYPMRVPISTVEMILNRSVNVGVAS